MQCVKKFELPSVGLIVAVLCQLGVSLTMVVTHAWLTGCEYGDHQVTYCSDRSRRDCYDVNIEQTCCTTCASQRNTHAPADCQFGDKASWCDPSQFQPHSCYSSADVCCETCAAYRTGPSGRHIITMLFVNHNHLWIAHRMLTYLEDIIKIHHCILIILF